jgi:hypothetical protein
MASPKLSSRPLALAAPGSLRLATGAGAFI